MNQNKAVELMPILWRLGTGKAYRDFPRDQDLAAVACMGKCILPLLDRWLDDECKIIKNGAAAAMAVVEPSTVRVVRRTPEPEESGVAMLAAFI